jgi:hypothetical protein
MDFYFHNYPDPYFAFLGWEANVFLIFRNRLYPMDMTNQNDMIMKTGLGKKLPKNDFNELTKHQQHKVYTEY